VNEKPGRVGNQSQPNVDTPLLPLQQLKEILYKRLLQKCRALRISIVVLTQLQTPQTLLRSWHCVFGKRVKQPGLCPTCWFSKAPMVRKWQALGFAEKLVGAEVAVFLWPW